MKSSNVTNPFTGKEMAEAYHQHRPHYHETPFQLLHDYRGKAFKKALDVACGTGQSTYSLSQYSKEIIGVDVSPEMVIQAQSNYPTLKFLLMNAESLDFPASFFDLVNISMGIHWFDHGLFLKGVEEILEPLGLLSVDNYGFKGIISSEENKQKLHHDFFEEFLPSVKKYNNYPEDHLLKDSKIDFLKELTYQKDIEMNQKQFISFVKTMSNFLSLSDSQKTIVSKKMDDVYGKIFEENTLKLGFGGRLKIFQRSA